MNCANATQNITAFTLHFQGYVRIRIIYMYTVGQFKSDNYMKYFKDTHHLTFTFPKRTTLSPQDILVPVAKILRSLHAARIDFRF